MENKELLTKLGYLLTTYYPSLKIAMIEQEEVTPETSTSTEGSFALRNILEAIHKISIYIRDPGLIEESKVMDQLPYIKKQFQYAKAHVSLDFAISTYTNLRYLNQAWRENKIGKVGGHSIDGVIRIMHDHLILARTYKKEENWEECTKQSLLALSAWQKLFSVDLEITKNQKTLPVKNITKEDIQNFKDTFQRYDVIRDIHIYTEGLVGFKPIRGTAIEMRDAVDHLNNAFISETEKDFYEQTVCAKEHLRRGAIESLQSRCKRYVYTTLQYVRLKKPLLFENNVSVVKKLFEIFASSAISRNIKATKNWIKSVRIHFQIINEMDMFQKEIMS